MIWLAVCVRATSTQRAARRHVAQKSAGCARTATSSLDRCQLECRLISARLCVIAAPQSFHWHKTRVLVPLPVAQTHIYIFSCLQDSKMPRVPSESYSGKKRCPICESSFRPQNIGPHIRKCERDKKVAEEARERKRKLHRMVEDCFTRTSDTTVALPDVYHASHFSIGLGRSRLSKLANIGDSDDPHASNPHHHAPPEMRAEGKECILVSTIGCRRTDSDYLS